MATLAIGGIGLVGGIVNAQANESRPTFGVTPAPDSGAPTPEYSAVAGHDGEIAGYVHTELFESGGPQPSTPEEAVEYNKTVKGDIYEVFDTEGNIVGYFATGDHGFVNSDTKDALVAQGYRLLEAPRPDPDAQPSPDTDPKDEVAPSTHEGEG